MGYVVISTMRRGAVVPAEPVDEAAEAVLAEHDRLLALPVLPRIKGDKAFGPDNQVIWRQGFDGTPVRVYGVGR